MNALVMSPLALANFLVIQERAAGISCFGFN